MSPAPGLIEDYIGWTPAILVTLTAATLWAVQRIRADHTPHQRPKLAGQVCDIAGCHDPATAVFDAARPDRVLYVCAGHQTRIQQSAARWVA